MLSQKIFLRWRRRFTAEKILFRLSLKKVFMCLCLIGGIILQPSSQIFSAELDSADRELFLIAQKAFDDGFYDVAMRYIQDYLSQYPQTEKRLPAHLLLGQCYFFKNQYLKAFETFQELLPYSEFKDATLFWLGETYLKGSDYAQAEKHYLQLIDLYPDSIYTPQGYYSLAWSYFEQKKYNEALDYFKQLTQKYPSHALAEDSAFKLGECAYNLSTYHETVEYFQDYVVKFPKSIRHDQAYFYAGESYYYLNDFSAAIASYVQSFEISKDPKMMVMAKVSMAWSLIKERDYAGAQMALTDALQLATDKEAPADDIYLGQANLYTEIEENEKALEAFNNVITLYPNSPRLAEAYLGKANILYALKNFDEAVESYQKVLEKFQSSEEFNEILEKARFGLAWTHLKKGQIDLSIQNFRRIMDTTNNKIVKISALTQIGDAYQDVGAMEKALDIYDQILREYPDSLYTDYVQFRQGLTLLKMDKLEAASLSFKTLKENFPHSKYLDDVNYYLGVAAFKKGDWSAAREQAELFLKDLPKNNEFNAEANYIMALSSFNLGETDKAIKLFEQIIKNFPQETTIIKDSEVGIAKCFFSLGDNKEAVKRFKMILSKYPKSESAQDALLWLGDYYLENGELNLAIDNYQQLLVEFPGSERINAARLELGQAYQAQGQYDKAVNQLKLIDDPREKEIYAKAKLAIADIFSKEIDPENAISTYENIAQSCPDFKRDAYVKMAKLYQKNHKLEDAAIAYEKAIASAIGMSDFTDGELQFSIGDLFETQGKFETAVEAYLKVPYLYGKEKSWVTKAYLRVGRIFEDKSDWPNAVVIYNKIVTLKTDEMKFAQERLDWINDNIPTLTQQ